LRPRDCPVSVLGGDPISDWPPVPPTPLVPGGRSVPSPTGPEFLGLLSAAVARGGCRSVLAEVMALAGEAPGLSDEQLRARLVGLAALVTCGLDGEIR